MPLLRVIRAFRGGAASGGHEQIWFPSFWRKIDAHIVAARHRSIANLRSHKGVRAVLAQLQQANLSQLGQLSGPRPLRTVGNNEFDLASYLEDSFWMFAILAERVFQRLRAARKQATKDTILFADDPVSKTILANKDGRPSGASGTILDELHDRNLRTIS